MLPDLRRSDLPEPWRSGNDPTNDLGDHAVERYKPQQAFWQAMNYVSKDDAENEKRKKVLHLYNCATKMAKRDYAFWVVNSYTHAKDKKEWTAFYCKYHLIPEEFLGKLQREEREWSAMAGEDLRTKELEFREKENTLKRKRMEYEAFAESLRAERARDNELANMRREREGMGANDPHFRPVLEERAFWCWWNDRCGEIFHIRYTYEPKISGPEATAASRR
jgi:hypothetical protein